MDQLSDPFDEVLMSFGQLMQQQQEGQTQASAEEDELMREHERQMQEHLDEVAALHDWRIRVQLVESLRREIVDTFWNGIPSRRRYYETRSPIEWVPESPSSAALNAIKRELWDSKPLPLNMADAETESDSECDSELRLVRSPQPRISFLIHSPIDPPLFDMDMPETDVNDNPLAPILEATVLSDSISELDLNEALLVQGDAASASDSSLGTIGTMVFEMEMHETVVEPQGTNQDQEASTEVKDDSDIDIDIGEELERVDSRPRALPIAVPGARDGNAHDVEDVFVEQFLRDVRHYTIGFDLDFFPYVVKQWIPGLREAALPGSFEHLLMHMFDDVDNVVRFQEDVRESGIRNYIRGHRKSASNDTELLDDESLQVESQSEAGPSSQRPAITGSTGEGVSEDHSTTDAFFSQELRALRLMVAPLRDHEAPFIWITSRINRPVEMREQFWASRSLIAGFKRQLIRRLRQSESWTIHYPKSNSPYNEGWERSLSLHQYRLDACGATASWEYTPDDDELLELSGPLAEAHEPHRVPELAPPAYVTPDVLFSVAQANEFTNVEAVQGYDKELLTLLVRIAQWLALARGHAAVHLFCDVARLFSSSGVDVSDPVQAEFCEHLLSMEVWPDQSGSPDPLPAGIGAESNDSGMFQDVEHGNRQLARVLMGVESLFHRVGGRRRPVGSVAGRRI